MTNEFLRIFLPVYFLLYFFVLVVLKAIITKKQIGKNPIVLSAADSAYGLLGFYLKLAIVLLAVYVVTFSAFPQWYNYFLPFKFLEHQKIKIIGAILLLVSFAWIIISQNNMRQSWRIGVDVNAKTELVTDGVFRFSRNPIYLGMIVSLFALFLVTPNAPTLFIAAISFVLIQIQVRLEEEYLLKMHAEKFLDYKKQTRRWL